MNAQERLRTLIAQQHACLRSSIPADREAAIIALIAAQERLPHPADTALSSDIVTGLRLANPGGNRAIQLCLESSGTSSASIHDPEGWAEGFLRECSILAEVETILSHCETGFMRLDDGHADGTISAWVTTRLAPPRWWERADYDWWATWLRQRHREEMQAAHIAGDAGYHRLADTYLKTMSHQFGYPDDAMIGDLTARTWLDILRMLLVWTFQSRDRDETTMPVPEHALVDRLASALDLEPEVAATALDAFTIDEDRAAWHAVVPGIAAAPFIRLGPDRIIPSFYGLTTEPLLFLTRELRRRDAERYHNAAHHREVAFRQDIYALFEDRRFLTSEGRIRLRHDKGNLRTDIDAAVFDRKTGTLGIFELKSQDPFARSAIALARQRDNLLYANRQVSGVLDWVKRNGADEIVSRIDQQVARKFRTHKVYPFVLGRYLAHFNDGAQPDARASWRSWPGVLRLLSEQPITVNDANPIASLHTRLARATAPIHVECDQPPRDMTFGDLRIRVYPSWAAYQTSASAER